MADILVHHETESTFVFDSFVGRRWSVRKPCEEPELSAVPADDWSEQLGHFVAWLQLVRQELGLEPLPETEPTTEATRQHESAGSFRIPSAWLWAAFVLSVLSILGLLASRGIWLVSGWELVAVLAIPGLVTVTSLATVLGRKIRIHGRWSEHGSAEIEVQSDQ